MSGNRDKINPNTNPGKPPAESREGGRNAERGREELAKPAGKEHKGAGRQPTPGAGTRKLRIATVHTLTTQAVLPTRGSAALHTI